MRHGALAHTLRRRPVLEDAVGVWRAAAFDATNDRIHDRSGRGNHARLGSATGADTNDPLFLRPSGFQRLRFPDVSGNGVTTPDSAALSITGNQAVAVYASCDTWTPGAGSFFGAKYVAVADQRTWAFGITSGGYLQTWLSATGGSGPANIVSTATVPWSATAGAEGWAAFTFNNDATPTVTFYTSTDPKTTAWADISWTQLGSAVTASVPASLFDGTANLEIGSYNGGTTRHRGGMHRSLVASGGLNTGTLAFDMDTRSISSSTSTTFTEGSINAATVTITRSSSGRKITLVDLPLLLLGTDDYLQIPDAEALRVLANRSLTVIAIARNYNINNGSAIQTLMNRQHNVLFGGYSLRSATATNVQVLLADDNATHVPSVTIASPTNGSVFALTLVRDVAKDTVTGYLNGVAATPVTDTTTTITESTHSTRAGATSLTPATTYWDGEVIAFAVFTRPLDVEEVKLATRELLGQA